ncbi:MAG: protein phosphatase 2C domain-containing protein [Bacteroidales bacterium]|nr:protein phosphatase 2C domain-containing protein [Bacteroidales bacterium]
MIWYNEHSQKGQFPLNEDRLQVKLLSDEFILAVMADGMGGLDHGEIAAEIAVHVIVSTLESKTLVTEADILNALFSADDAIEKESQLRGMKMGCALVIVCIQGRRMLFLSLGNIRISSCDENGLIIETFTKDSTFTDSLGGSYLTNCLRGKGFRETPSIEIIELSKTFHVRICTDGFYNPGSKDDASVIDIFGE